MWQSRNNEKENDSQTDSRPEKLLPHSTFPSAYLFNSKGRSNSGQNKWKKIGHFTFPVDFAKEIIVTLIICINAIKKMLVDTMMRKNACSFKSALFFLLFFSLFVTAAQAEVVYVTDRLLVLLRSEQGGGEKIAKLFSDTPLQLLEKSGLYLKVRTQDGNEGWVEEQYTTTDPPKQTIIDSLEAEIKRLEANLTRLSKERGPLGERIRGTWY
jgi:predicted DNA-binding transcriptional regulator